MLYECLVIDNSNFFKNGTIRVRIKKEVFSSTMMKDISINPQQSINEYGGQRYEQYGEGDKEFKYNDRDVRVMTSIGGAYDYGLFILPQPNTWGIVSETNSYDENNSDPRFVWIGALAMFNKQSKNINVPSDKLDKKNGCNNGEINIEEPYSELIFKQKETHMSDNSQKITDKSQETLSWKARPTQNMIVMNGNKITIVHNIIDEENNSIGSSTVEVNNEKIALNCINYEDNLTNKLTLNNSGSFELSNEDPQNSIINSISADANNMLIYHNDKDSSTSLHMGDNFNGEPMCSLNFKANNNKIATEIIMDSNNGMTINSSSNISINPGKGGTVSLGTGEGYILTTQNPGTWNYDNHTVTAVKTAKA